MIESKKFKEIESDFADLCKKIEKDNDQYKQEICYLFEQALENIEKEYFEIAMFLFCVIIESIASRKNCEEFKTFDLWLIDNKEDRLNKFIEEIKVKNPEEVVKNWHEKYRETYGPRKNFVKIIIDSYKNEKKLPAFSFFEIKEKDGIKTSTLIKDRKKDARKNFEKRIKEIYDKYRSPFVHRGKFLSAGVYIETIIGSSSHNINITLQDLAIITLEVMKVNL